jgi:nucleoside 2-deoxyribosyltransferase
VSTEEKIERIRAFKEALDTYNTIPSPKLRTYLNENSHAVQREVLEAGCLKTFTIAPPPAVGGMVMRNVNLFDMMFERIYLMNPIPPLIDMLDQTIGALRDPPPVRKNNVTRVIPDAGVEGFVFIAMPMDAGNRVYDDVHDAIKAAAVDCGLNAERVGDVESNERITDRILESIRKAEFVVVDLTDARPNVFYEAGYAQGLGKIPVYVARKNTRLEFDLKDYPVIFFESLRELRQGLITRFRGIRQQREG